MNREKYLEKRNGLLNSAKEALENGDIEKSKELRAEIEKLDKDYEDEAKEMANLQALMGAQTTPTTVVNFIEEQKIDNGEKKDDIENVYKEAFALTLMGKGIDSEQAKTVENYNKDRDIMNDANLAKNNSLVIPHTVMTTIWETMREEHPILRDIAPTHIPGSVTIVRDEETDEDGSWVDEETESGEGELDLTDINLDGCELTKGILISWKLKKMSTDAFINYIANKIAKKMGNALASGYINGKGKPGTGDTWKPEAKGIITALEEESGTPQVGTYTESITYADMTSLMSRIKSGRVTKIYASHATIWDELANIVDSIGRPMFIPDTTAGGVGRILGSVVEREDAVPEGSALAGDVSFYAANVNEDIAMYQEEKIKARKTYYMGYAIADGAPVVNNAFSLLKSTVVVTLSDTTFDKNPDSGKYKDVVVTATLPDKVTFDKLFIEETEVAKDNGNSWGVSGNTATLKKEYLETLTEDTTFTMRFSNKESRDFTIKITDTTE